MKIKILLGAIIIALLSSSAFAQSEYYLVVKNSTSGLMATGIEGSVSFHKTYADDFKFPRLGPGAHSPKYYPDSAEDMYNFSITVKGMYGLPVAYCALPPNTPFPFYNRNMSVSIIGSLLTGYYSSIWRHGEGEISRYPCEAL